MVNKFTQFLVAFISLWMLHSCSGPQKEYVLKVKLNKLTQKDMYEYNLVKDVIFDAQELNVDSIKARSRESFLKGVDEYKNKHNAAAAVPLFKQSILTFPDAKTYYELGNALMELNTEASLDESIKAYRVAEELDIKPIASVYYKMACAQNMIGTLKKSDEDEYMVISYLRKSFINGFYDTLTLAKDTRINSILSTMSYKTLLRELESFKYKEDRNGLFELFKQAYPRPVEFEAALTDLTQYENKESISYDFAVFVPEMQNTEFGREVSNDFFYNALVQETPAYTALIYTSVSFWGDHDALMPSFTSLVTYDPMGIIIDRKLIACQCSAEKVKTVKIKDNKVYVEDFKRIWKQPIDKVSFDDNEVDKFESLAKLTYTINEDGTIQASEIPANYMDTVITKDQSKNTPQ
ncbi:hypothetical protein [Cytophaga hutchinsonii]|uniref:Uncharacterized protein n=1 Tax=Cytophaga hutchinsonii (strain ATCC 33406 / DSM 1761 / CIP 103989 / NBRC 15051 / NCIMB 9469 / D465) TaxID=269798 RepID=A0A6N4SS39_CYTH3|nr:hypothetical protein [Cytophaga hutchinsonii]ABG59105.1 hypothetical protein CHU_1838 [Cytophaga hutchinsonii ATCC 33406]SFX36733.1 hypothetical protein SAMN04487930_103203 [Cytophaga hutchinsonii ATCC 33406]